MCVQVEAISGNISTKQVILHAEGTNNHTNSNNNKQ